MRILDPASEQKDELKDYGKSIFWLVVYVVSNLHRQVIEDHHPLWLKKWKNSPPKSPFYGADAGRKIHILSMQLESSGVVTLQSCRWNCRNHAYSWNTLNSQRGKRLLISKTKSRTWTGMARNGALQDVALCDLNLEVNTLKPWVPQLLQFESCLEINHPPAYEDGVG